MSEALLKIIRHHGPYIVLGYLFAMICVGIILLTNIVHTGSSKDEQETNFRDLVQNYLSKGLVDKIEVTVRHRDVTGTRASVHLANNSRTEKEFVNQSIFTNESSSAFTQEIGNSVQSNTIDSPDVNKKMFFYIGSVDAFERNLEMVQLDMGITRINLVCVIYKITEPDKLSPHILLVVTMILFYSGTLFFMYLRNRRSKVGIINSKDIGIRFRDVAGCEQAKIELMEFVNFLKHPKFFTKLGARMPKGAILCGPPGTGKTLMAMAMAGEANVTFIYASGSDFDEVYQGLGASRVRELFEKARDNSPCILFIDEIDAVGRKRSDRSRNGDDQTLNQLLVEMDGFGTTKNVVVIAATNRLDVLDPALIRPGRFDRKINLDLPNIKARASILNVHLSSLKTNMDKSKLSRDLAANTSGMTGADLENVCNESAMIAARDSSPSITDTHFQEALERVLSGIKKTNDLQLENKKIVAYHEAGHCVAGWFLEFADPVVKVSITPRGGTALGFTRKLPNDNCLPTKEKVFHEICFVFGGRASEEIFFDQITAGSTDDLKKATQLAHTFITQFGMNDKMGPINLDNYVKDDTPMLQLLSNETMNLIDNEVRELLQSAYSRTKSLLQDHKVDVEKVAGSLLKNGILCRDAIIKLLGPRPFKEQLTYESMVDGDIEENTALPKIWKRFKNSGSDPEVSV